LERKGFTEVVLTGVNISLYFDSGLGLPELLEFLLAGTKTIRLRLSSIEPDEITGDFFRVLANPRIRPHFHLSLQSGSTEILSKMGRSYTTEDIEKTVALLRKVKGDLFLACDIIAGFPGENDREFEKTFSMLERTGFAWIHAFPFSPRPGTPAFDFPGKVNEKDTVKRVRQLTDLASKSRRDYINRWKGKELEAVIEAGKKLPNGFVNAVSENYLKLLVNCGDDPGPAPGALIRCRILENGVSKDKFPGHFDAPAEIVSPS
jgi:threonylcarbamoyladenosine tRNA methylthiotransferase MtaB